MPEGRLTLADLREIPLARLKGVGDVLEGKLAAMELHNVLDLLQHYPRRWVDRTQEGRHRRARRWARRRRSSPRCARSAGAARRQGRAIVEVVVSDGTSLLNITFFNQPWREKQLSVGTEASFFGKLDVYRGKRQMTNPVVDVVGRAGSSTSKTGVIVPVYPQSGKAEVFTWQLRALVADALAKCKRAWLRRSARRGDPRPSTISSTATRALRAIHRPESMAELGAAQQAADLRRVPAHAGRVSSRASGRSRPSSRASATSSTGRCVAAFVAGLPFALTGDQQRAIDEIAADLAGAGADAPAAAGRRRFGQDGRRARRAARSPCKAATRARSWRRRRCSPSSTTSARCGCSTGSTVPASGSLLARAAGARRAADEPHDRGRAARASAAGLRAGEIDILVGTHALLYGDAQFTRLGLAVIDEQHRFGVEQRALLRGKGDEPDVLVMTATPIPRTAAMLVYGDLDRSELREMPPGRTPIATTVVGPNPLDQAAAWAELRAEVDAGHQAYVVCPLVEDKGKVEAKARPRSTNAAGRGAAAACASGCCTAR